MSHFASEQFASQQFASNHFGPGPGPGGPPTDDIELPQRPSGGGGIYRPRKDHPIDPYLYDEELRRKRIALIKQQDAEIEEMIITLITKGFI